MSARRLGSLGIVLVWLLECPAPGFTEPPPKPSRALRILQLLEVLVTASRVPGGALNVNEFPGHATVITAEQIAQSGTSSLPELLHRYAGVTVMDTHGFGLGADASVNLRGIVNSSRTGALVLVNGVRQNRPTGDEVHWQSFPPATIERIEIIRGGGGLAYGEGALSGVINIITKKTSEKLLETEEQLELGSFGQRTEFASVRGSNGPVSYGTSYHRRDVQGYRESTTSRTTTVTTHVGVDPIPQVHLETEVLHSQDTSYFPGGITPDQSQARRRQHGSFNGFFDDDTTQVSLDAQVRDLAGMSFAATAFWRDRDSDSVTNDSRFATITPSMGLTLRTSHELDTAGLRHAIVSGIELLDEKATVGTRGAARFDESNKGSIGLFTEETLRILDRATLMAGIRFDRARFEEDISFPAFIGTLRFQGFSPRVGLSVDLLKPLTVYANYARPYKAPDVDDFSAVVPTTFVGNINLQPQQADDYELGLRLHDERVGAFDATVFFNTINDEILFNATDFQNQNMDTRRLGVELSAEPRLPIKGLVSRIAYTFMDAKFREGAFVGNTIPGVPEHQLTLGLTYALTPRLSCSLDWLLVQAFFRINDFGNQVKGPNYGVLDLGLRWVRGPLAVHVKILNVTNEEYTSFQSSNGLAISTGENPAPPTTVVAGVTVKF